MAAHYTCDRCGDSLTLEDVNFRDVSVNYEGFSLHMHLCEPCDKQLLVGMKEVLEQIMKQMKNNLEQSNQ